MTVPDAQMPVVVSSPIVVAANPFVGIEGIWNGESAILQFEQFLEIPEIAAVISYVRNALNGTVVLTSNAQVQ